MTETRSSHAVLFCAAFANKTDTRSHSHWNESKGAAHEHGFFKGKCARPAAKAGVAPIRWDDSVLVRGIKSADRIGSGRWRRMAF